MFTHLYFKCIHLKSGTFYSRKVFGDADIDLSVHLVKIWSVLQEELEKSKFIQGTF